MAENKEYQVRVHLLGNNGDSVSTVSSHKNYELADNDYKDKVTYWRKYNSLRNTKLMEIQLIEILNDDESITLKSHSYGKK